MVKTPAPKSSLSTSRRMLDSLGVRDRVAPRRVEHPLLRLNWVMAVLWLADIRHRKRSGAVISRLGASARRAVL